MLDTALDEVRELLAAMVEIPSITVRPGADGEGEASLSAWIAGWLRDQGIEVTTQEAAPGRNNVIGRIPGRDRSRTLLLNSHLDTVEVEGMTVEPFGAEVRGTRLYGRGSCDAKGCLTAFLLAAKRHAQAPEPPPIDVLFLATIAEETGTFSGIRTFAESLPPVHGVVGALIGEPTELRAVLAHKGTTHLEVTIRTNVVGSSQGDAIYRMAPVLEFVEHTLAAELDSLVHPLVGPPSMAVTTIEGGMRDDFVRPTCRAGLSRRTVPGEDPRAVFEDLKSRIEALDPAHITVTGEIGPAGLHTSAEEPLAQSLRRALESHGLDGTGIGVNYGTDGLLLAPRGIPVVVFGPGSIDVAHQADESVDLREVATAVAIVTSLIGDFNA